jgi:hypothetical protein
VTNQLERSTQAYNTYLVTKDSYTDKTREQVESAIVRFVSRNDTEFDEILSIQGKDRAARIKKQLSNKIPRSYRTRVLNTDHQGFPVRNVIIIKRAEDDPIPEEVFFGWGYSGESRNKDGSGVTTVLLLATFRGITIP